MAGPGDIVGPFEIEELTGDRRRLTLSGRALPYRPYSLEGEQRAEFTWYAGSPVATVQPLGAEEKETTIGGWWKDRFISPVATAPGELPPFLPDTPAVVSGRPIANVVELVALVDDIRRKGQLVEVTWLQTVRRGLVVGFRQTWHTLRDVEYEIRFRWSSQGDERQVANVRRDEDLSDVVDRAAAEALRLDTASSPALGVPVDPDFAAEVNASVTRIKSSATELGDALVAMVDGAVAPVESAQRMLGLVDFVQAEAQRVIDEVYARPDRQIEATTTLAAVAAIPIARAVAAAAANRRLARQARRNRHDAARARLRVARAVEPDLLAVFFARADTDLRSVSRDFYGTPDEWPRLRRFNALPGSRLRAGQLVLVPQRSR